jgi:hypothetical protein
MGLPERRDCPARSRPRRPPGHTHESRRHSDLRRRRRRAPDAPTPRCRAAWRIRWRSTNRRVRPVRRARRRAGRRATAGRARARCPTRSGPVAWGRAHGRAAPARSRRRLPGPGRSSRCARTRRLGVPGTRARVRGPPSAPAAQSNGSGTARAALTCARVGCRPDGARRSRREDTSEPVGFPSFSLACSGRPRR